MKVLFPRLAPLPTVLWPRRAPGHRLPVLLAGLLTLLLTLGTGPAGAVNEEDILRPEDAFRYTVAALDGEVRVRWTIAPAHYLYRQRMSFESRTPGVTLGPAVMPQGIPHEDEFFGPMEIYRGQAEVRLPLAQRPPGPVSLELALKSQGCADMGLCYPPQTWTARVDLPPAPAGGGVPGAGATAGGGLAALLGDAQGPNQGPKDTPLPPAEAFQWSVATPGPFQVQVTWRIAAGYYLYRHTLKVVSESPEASVGAPDLPPGLPQYDEEYGDTLVFRDEVTLTAALARRGPEATTVPLRIEFQGCKDDSICYPPQAVTAMVALPAAGPGDGPGGVFPADGALPLSEQDRLFEVIRDGNILLVMGLFAGLGLLLSFTPCCLPMYPILSGIIVGQGSNVSDLRAFLLSLAYVLGMAVTYTLLGAAFAAAGASVQAIFQQPWVIIGVAVLFVALALSMFGLYELQVPAAVQTRLTLLSGRQKSGSYLGAGVMGMISAAVVTTCVTPPLVAALTVIARTGDVTRGALALFALAIGMGIPLLAIGASAGRLMPKAGAWMVTVKAAFGLMMLAMAVWMLDRLWPGTLTLALWAVLLVLAGVFLGAFTPLAGDASTGRKVGKGLGLVSILYGAALLIGALAGNDDPLRPLKFAAGPAGETAAQEAHFTRVKTVADLDRELAAAQAAGRPVMLDFYADWCVSCKEMEKYTFPHPEVQAVLGETLLLQADVTAVDAADQALMQRFGIVGPPTIVFFGPDGAERTGQRVVGFQKAADFAAHIRAVLGSNTALARL